MYIDMKLDNYLKMYFNQSYLFLSFDQKGESKKGDIVLLSHLKKPSTQSILFGIEKILFQLDNIVDPITNKNVSRETQIINEHLKKIEKQEK